MEDINDYDFLADLYDSKSEIWDNEDYTHEDKNIDEE